MGDETRPGGKFTRRQFIEGANAGIVALETGALSLGLGSLANAQEAGPHAVREIENIWIPMSDGTKIAARLWLPEGAETDPVPVIMEYIPYRKRDGTRLFDETRHPYLASHGYACVRPDIRGSGDSEGLPQDEYVKQEQDDGVEIIAWLARQPWCTGKVGMFGISWDGFSSLQVAARRPPELKAIITHCSTDDRYTDDAHYSGGCIIQDMFVWGSVHTINGMRPPDPEIVGDRWREMWLNRLNNLDFYVGNWVKHQHRDEFWQHGSVRDNYDDLECAVYAVGGWVDSYSSAIPRMLEGLSCPRKGLIGPWGHQYPHQGNPGPAIDWLTESLRWWDYWLKDIDTGIMDEPMYRVWMQDEAAVRGARSIEGRWVAEDSWPSSRIKTETLFLNTSGIGSKSDAEEPLSVNSQETVGVTGPHWCPFNMDTELPTDQRLDDGRSITFDSRPLQEDFEFLGAPVVHLDLAVNKPVAFISVRLNEVEPTGVSNRVTYHVLNLTHRNSHEHPEPMEPGRRYAVRVQLHDCAHRFKTGNRIRVSVSTNHWPLIWPAPEPVELTIFAGKSRLELPIRPPRNSDQELQTFGPPFVPETSPRTVIQRGSRNEGNKIMERDVARQTLTTRSDGGGDRYRIEDIGTEVYGAWTEESEIAEYDPTSATLTHHRMQGYKRGDWDVRLEGTLSVSLTSSEFLVTGDIKAFEHDTEVFAKTWNEKIARMLV